jgi:hypothetical protein
MGAALATRELGEGLCRASRRSPVVVMEGSESKMTYRTLVTPCCTLLRSATWMLNPV